MPSTIETTVYQYDELDERAKERARDWYREGIELDESGFCSDDFERICDILGVKLRQQAVKLYGGDTRYKPVIYWSGFSSQGDGACFEGDYSYSKGSPKRIREYAPLDQELHRIADELAKVQRANFYQLTASMRHSGHYYHSGCMRVDVERGDERDMTPDAEDTVIQCMRDLADWYYRYLEKEWEYQNSDETVAENIRANEYTFTESGRRFE